jgi:hypothetical protein
LYTDYYAEIKEYYVGDENPGTEGRVETAQEGTETTQGGENRAPEGEILEMKSAIESSFLVVQREAAAGHGCEDSTKWHNWKWI